MTFSHRMTKINNIFMPNLLCCPHCKGELTFATTQVNCNTCQQSWPQILGIPDFRDPNILYVQQDLVQAEALMAEFTTKSRAELVELSVKLGSFYHDDQASAKLQQQRIRGRQQWQINSHVIDTRLTQLSALIPLTTSHVAADVGCGSGSHLPALSQRYEQVVGMDAALAELILAKKLLVELGIENVQLACAFAEQLPFKTQSIDLAVSLYVLEHVHSAQLSLAEVYRALKPQGHFYFAVPFRYTLIPPEPHTHVWWVGWLPRQWQTRYVQYFRPNFDFDSIHLFSYHEINRLAQTIAPNQVQFFDPGFDRRFPPVQQNQRAWQLLQYSPLLLKIARFIFRRSIHAIVTRLS